MDALVPHFPAPVLVSVLFYLRQGLGLPMLHDLHSQGRLLPSFSKCGIPDVQHHTWFIQPWGSSPDARKVRGNWTAFPAPAPSRDVIFSFVIDQTFGDFLASASRLWPTKPGPDSCRANHMGSLLTRRSSLNMLS